MIAKVPRKFKPPAGDAHVRVESARGDMGWYVRQRRHRVPVPAASPHGLVRGDEHHRRSVSRGLMIADLVALIASLDVVAPEVDR